MYFTEYRWLKKDKVLANNFHNTANGSVSTKSQLMYNRISYKKTILSHTHWSPMDMENRLHVARYFSAI